MATPPAINPITVYTELFPLLLWGVKALLGALGTMTAALTGVLVWYSKKRDRKLSALDEKIDRVLLIQMHCDGCRDSVDVLAAGQKPGGQRWYDPPQRPKVNP